MATYTAVVPSGSTDGKPIKVAASATPGTTFHTAHATALDEVFLEVFNTDTAERTVTVEWGGTTDPDNLFPKAYTVPIKQWVTLASGIRITNSCTVKVFASAANVIIMRGNINRIT